MTAPPDYEVTVGLEAHVQLATRTKIFCAAAHRHAAPPNTLVDPMTLGLPGALPVLGREAVELGLRLAVALGCDIARRSRFVRKHYLYPDLPKGYQVTQLDEPLATRGRLHATIDGRERVFAIRRVHLEEDSGKSHHDVARDVSLVDLDRAGAPLAEVVGEPDLTSGREAAAWLRALREVAVAAGASGGQMQHGHLRCDANVSVRRRGQRAPGERTELKNLNSFRFVARAIEHEVERQVATLAAGGTVRRETRLWDASAGRTRPLRAKESARDYRYLPEPDLMPLDVDDAWLARVRAELPELPRARRRRLVADHHLDPGVADALTRRPTLAVFFEAVALAASVADAGLIANWVRGPLVAALGARRTGEDEDTAAMIGVPIAPDRFAALVDLVASERLSAPMARRCLDRMVSGGVSPGDWLARHGPQRDDAEEIRAVVVTVLDASAHEVQTYLAGKTALAGHFVGRVMRAMAGQANPRRVRDIVHQALEERRR